MTARTALAAGALVLGLACSVRAQAPYPPPPPGAPGTYVLVPRAGGYVYVPLDPSGMPTGLPGLGGGPSVPAAPRAPSVPSSPSVPSVPPPAGAVNVGYLQTEIEPAGADVFIDGRRAGITDPFGAARTLYALEAGMHHVEITREGFKPLTTEIEIAPRVIFAIRGRLDPD